MANFVKLAEGVDVAPLVMAIERQRVLLADGRCDLYAEDDWQGGYFAFPQVREVLLNLMRRVECGKLLHCAICGPGEYDGLPDASQASVLLALYPVVLRSGDEELAMPAGAVVFCSGAEALVIAGRPDSCALAVVFSPMP